MSHHHSRRHQSGRGELYLDEEQEHVSARDLALEIRTFITDNFLLGQDADSLRNDTSLTRGGVIDSVGVVELMQFLETGYAITIADEEAVPENIDTIDNIVRYLEAKGVTTPRPDGSAERGDVRGVARL